MGQVPAHPKIYHITHLRNLPQIAQSGVLWSDAKRIELGLKCDVVGMAHIKRRRLEEIEVHCHRGTRVGDYVPFYFCPRSIMLYLLYRGNHPELDYHGGQRPIVHLEADLPRVVAWARANGRRWAFTDRNAGSSYTHFSKNMDCLNDVNWEAVAANDWRDPVLKEGKQAEFLLHESFPWELIERVGVCNNDVVDKVRRALAEAEHHPEIAVEQGWYY